MYSVRGVFFLSFSFTGSVRVAIPRAYLYDNDMRFKCANTRAFFYAKTRTACNTCYCCVHASKLPILRRTKFVLYDGSFLFCVFFFNARYFGFFEESITRIHTPVAMICK